MCFMTGKKNGRHWLNTLESGFKLQYFESQWEHCWSRDHREIGADHMLMQMSIVFLTSADLQWLIPDELMRWFGCAVPSWKAAERCSEISMGIVSPEANMQHNSVPFKQAWKGKKQQHLSLSWWKDRLWWKNKQTKNTQNYGVLGGQEFQRESIKAMLSSGGRKHQQIISELVELCCSHHLQKTLMHTWFYTS